MIVLNLELDNLFGFEDFKINFSYPKKVENSSIKPFPSREQSSERH